MNKPERKARILLFDIETSPNIGYSFGKKWEVNIVKFIREWEFLCFAYKWLGEKETHSFSRDNFNRNSEGPIIHQLFNVFEQADVIIAHNGDQFDNKKSKTKFLEHIGNPPSPWKTIDTKKIAKSQFDFNSNSLDDLAEFLGIGRKIKTTFDLWEDVMNNSATAWREMVRYNKHDIFLLEGVYQKFLPFITNHPNVALLQEKKFGCSNCGSTDARRGGSDRFLKSGKIQRRYQCKKCNTYWCG